MLLNLLRPPAATKILWLKRHEPEHYARLAHVLLPHDYINYCLTGRLAMEASSWAASVGGSSQAKYQWKGA